MGLISTILIGFIVGLLARALTPGKDPGGFIVTTLIGIAGSLLATFLGRSLGWYQIGQSAGFFAALIGAIILLVVYRMFRRKSY
ncbi:GlsB/YeaQ/YmgE family stress response membrane protein [Noviherbaspirillum sp. CPCC 100848]|uniref:GlsB/YeaQ/YmgE family stress response membrane protein n=1 Tax=Noviherbaspirillum album TaxID=3080276 RepID=A0ABU6JIV5_9BURK|nr:GlsB/YeaQ/YmgE family stress response membrane protein [Noviherbaspirillum sp. CPCC 100848]MEC4723190.1 GlsB/YeaQ/YmgE family stress response membrane protein [Noviherbaspirillum sp. CPCC 100848]